jgi:hypothetical protein
MIRDVRMFEFTKTPLQTRKLFNVMNKHLVKPIAIIVFEASFVLYNVNFVVEDQSLCFMMSQIMYVAGVYKERLRELWSRRKDLKFGTSI